MTVAATVFTDAVPFWAIKGAVYFGVFMLPAMLVVDLAVAGLSGFLRARAAQIQEGRDDG